MVEEHSYNLGHQDFVKGANLIDPLVNDIAKIAHRLHSQDHSRDLHEDL